MAETPPYDHLFPVDSTPVVPHVLNDLQHNSNSISENNSPNEIYNSESSIQSKETDINSKTLESVGSNDKDVHKNPLLICGIISEDTASVLMPPPVEILPGRKRPLRIKSCARVMTSPEVLEDLQQQKTAILNKPKAKRKQVSVKPKVPPKRKKVPKRNSELEDHHCHICELGWEDEVDEMKSKWVGCETNDCPKWICQRCLPDNFNYKEEFFCNACKKK